MDALRLILPARPRPCNGRKKKCESTAKIHRLRIRTCNKKSARNVTGGHLENGLVELI